VLVQDEKLAHTSFSLRWNDFVQDALVLLREGNLAHARFPLGLNDVV
jgi:hypothetical protein